MPSGMHLRALSLDPRTAHQYFSERSLHLTKTLIFKTATQGTLLNCLALVTDEAYTLGPIDCMYLLSSRAAAQGSGLQKPESRC